jgi:hypothetical protein
MVSDFHLDLYTWLLVDNSNHENPPFPPLIKGD